VPPIQVYIHVLLHRLGVIAGNHAPPCEIRLPPSTLLYSWPSFKDKRIVLAKPVRGGAWLPAAKKKHIIFTIAIEVLDKDFSG
jgi:hypothetical protein